MADDRDDFHKIEIDLKQWATTDRTYLISMKLSLSEFIQLLCEKIDKITSHSFIVRSQSSYLVDIKEIWEILLFIITIHS